MPAGILMHMGLTIMIAFKVDLNYTKGYAINTHNGVFCQGLQLSIIESAELVNLTLYSQYNYSYYFVC